VHVVLVVNPNNNQAIPQLRKEAMQNVSSLVSKDFVLGLDTGIKRNLVLGQGFTKEFIDSSEERLITFDGSTGRPVIGEPQGKHRNIMINRPVLGLGIMETPDKLIIITALYCQNRTYYMVIKGPIIFVFHLDVTSLDMKDAVRELLVSNLLKGPRIYEHTASITVNFWAKVLAAVYKEPEIIDIQLMTRDGLPVPSRIYFDPRKPLDTILSVGGWCHGFDLRDFPKQQISVGTKQYAADNKVRAGKDDTGLMRGNRIIVKKSNDYKTRDAAFA
jgi:hypothetical protein